MTRTIHVCTGCGEELRSKRDLVEEQGTVYSTWHCRVCQTTVPGMIAEKIKHQKQFEPRSDPYSP